MPTSDEWLKRQPGFQSRRIAVLDDGSIVDMLIWESADRGRDAARRIMEEMGHSPVHAAIDQGSVVWSISAGLASIGPRVLRPPSRTVGRCHSIAQ